MEGNIIEANVDIGEPETIENVHKSAMVQRKRKRKNVSALEPKKRKVVEARWKAAQAKEACNAGVAHVTLRGKQRAARSIKPGCAAACKKECRTRISENLRKLQFERFWNTKSKTAQWSILAKLVTVVPVKRRTVELHGTAPYRKNSYEYHLQDENLTRIPVCQTMFLQTFDVSVKCVRSALTKTSPDKRGKLKRKRLSRELEDSVETHNYMPDDEKDPWPQRNAADNVSTDSKVYN